MDMAEELLLKKVTDDMLDQNDARDIIKQLKATLQPSLLRSVETFSHYVNDQYD